MYSIAERVRPLPFAAANTPTPDKPALLLDRVHRVFRGIDAPAQKQPPRAAQELVVVSGLQRGLRVRIPDRPLVIGRSPESGVCLADGRISRRHCQLLRCDGELWILDLGSTNRTYVNGRAVHLAELVRGDRVMLGSTVLDAV